MQTKCQVIDSLLRKQPVERVGVSDGPWGTTIKKWKEQGMPTDEKGEVDIHEHFDFDIASVGGWFEWAPKCGASEVLEETSEWRVTRNGAGAALKYWKEKDGTPEHIDFLMNSREVWERDYKPHLLSLDRKRLNVEETKKSLAKHRAHGFWTHYGHMFIWEIMRASMGDYTMYMSLVDDKGWVHDFCQTYLDFYKMNFKVLFDEAGVPDGMWLYEDMGYKHRLFASPETLGEMIFPYYAQLVEFFHSYGLPVVLHTCGFTEPALDMIVDAGFDGLNPMENKAGNDPFRIAEQYGDKLAFFGGLDARILETNDRSIIKREVGKYIDGMKSRGARLCFGSDHSLSTNIDYDSFKYALEVYHEHKIY